MTGRRITAAMIAVAAVLTLFGAADGQPEQVLAKAARVCLECIGIG